MYSFESYESDSIVKSRFDYFLLYGVGSFGCGVYFGFLFSLILVLAPILNALLGFMMRGMAFDENDKFSIPFFNIISISFFFGIFFGTWVAWHGFYSSFHMKGDLLFNVLFFSPFIYVIFYCVHDLIYAD